jgi:hypothetical protein
MVGEESECQVQAMCARESLAFRGRGISGGDERGKHVEEWEVES